MQKSRNLAERQGQRPSPSLPTLSSFCLNPILFNSLTEKGQILNFLTHFLQMSIFIVNLPGPLNAG